MASGCRFFDEDSVYRINRKKFVDVGLVLENAEFLSSDEEQEDDSTYPDWQRMKRGHVRIAWHPNGVEEVLAEKKVRLFDRSLMPGDVVRKLVKGKDTQLGYCRYTSVKAAVQVVGTKQVIIGVDSKDLLPMEEFAVDIAVFRNSWVGMVKTVKSDLTLRCTDGSRCVLSDFDALDMEDILDKRDRLIFGPILTLFVTSLNVSQYLSDMKMSSSVAARLDTDTRTGFRDDILTSFKYWPTFVKTSEFKKYSYYPGQQLWGPTYCFENAKWISLNSEMEELVKKSAKNVRATVEDVKVTSLGVQWVCRAYREEANFEIDEEPPKYIVQGEDLKSVKMMNIFEPCTLQIGDRNYLIIKDCYRIISLNDWRNEMATHLKTDSPQEPTVHKSKLTIPFPEKAQEDEQEEISCNGIDGNDSDFEDIDDENDEGMCSDSTSVTSHSTSSSIGRKRGCKHKSKKGPSLATKMLKKKKIKRARRHISKEILPLKIGDKVVTETLITETKAHVVWQDGSVETDIPSTHLYPVHHLDGHEFFPGDFVVDSKESRPHEYGVVKQVDHNGRTALVTWMKTYHAGADPHPDVLSEQEVSVYDIKDHPDFKYRPGSCVIRVANFEDSDPECTAGQVVDVHPNGKVEVSWVSGKTSLCYPQVLYRVGEYDSDDLWGDDDSFCDDEDSWETESEASIFGESECGEKEMLEMSKMLDMSNDCNAVGDTNLKTAEKEEEKSAEDSKSMQEKLLANIEKLRAGMARLEEVFTQNPTLQTCNVMRRLLELYKHCRVLDQLLGTTYFHEKHLQSLVDRLRHRGRVNSIQHVADQISRLFSIGVEGQNAESTNSLPKDTSPPNEDTSVETPQEEIVNCEGEKLEFSILIEASDIGESLMSMNLTDGKTENGLKNSNSNPALLSPNTAPLLSPLSNNNEPRNICQQLCSILKSRLLKAHEDVEQRFGMSHSDTTALLAAESDTPPKDQTSEVTTPVDAQATAVSNKDMNDMLRSVGADEEAPEKEEVNTAGQGVFSVAESVPDNHKYKLSILQPTDLRAFFRTVRKEMHLLKTSLPDGIIVKGFDDRIDLYSVLIKGPKRTPYEDGLFFFDFQLPADYPKAPPLCHYISYCSDRLNPNLYEGGKVCVSLLGTWGGKGTEVWSPESSNLLQVIVSIQGLILVSEPYFNEAGYERQRGTQLGRENSRMYNEMVVLKLVQSMTKLVVYPIEVFKEEIMDHFRVQASKLIRRLERWLLVSEEWNSVHPTTPSSPTVFKEFHLQSYDCSNEAGCSEIPLPEFPLIPASKGFCLTLRKSLASFRDAMASCNILTS